MNSPLPALLAALALSPLARASDWYVDAVNGNNANSGASAASAWKTLTFALASAPAGAQTIYVLPGLYDAANAEVFPLAPKPDHAVVALAGSAQTVVHATVGQPVFVFAASTAGAPSYGPASRLEGLTLRGGAAGVHITSTTAQVDLTLRELDVTQTGDGLYLSVFGIPGLARVTLERVAVHGCTRGMYVSNESPHSAPASSLTARDSSFANNALGGVRFHRANRMTALFERCRLDFNGLDGVFSSAFTALNLTATFRDCSLSGNGRDGWRSDPNMGDLNGVRTLLFERCTIAHNVRAGCLFFDDAFNTTDDATLSHSIVYGNALTIDYGFSWGGAAPTVERCCLGDPTYATSGSFVADPRYRSPASGDYRLRWGSPCIDAATIAPPAGTRDLLGRLRDADGDLNTSEVSDLGCFEFRPLELVGTARLGTLLQWELWGQQASPTTLYWTRVGLPGAPTSTPFGQLDLDPTLASVYRVTTAGASAPNVLQRSIPNSPFLIGTTLAFQALTDNPAAPSGKAYTNPIEFTIAP